MLTKLTRSIKRGRLQMLAILLAAAVSMLGMLPRVSNASVVGADEANLSTQARAENIATIKTALERKQVAARLADYGLTPEEVTMRLDNLSDEQVAEAASQIEEINAGGDPLGAVLSAVLALLIILIVLHLLGYIDLRPPLKTSDK